MSEIADSLTIGEARAAGAPVGGMSGWLQRVKSAQNKVQLAKLHTAAAGQAMRAGGESLLMGGLLGAAHASLKTGLDVKKVPIDAVVGVLGLVGGAVTAGDEFAVDLRNSGAAALSIFSFRKTFALVAKKRKEKGKEVGGTFTGDDEGFVPHGDFGAEDPIIAAARFL